MPDIAPHVGPITYARLVDALRSSGLVDDDRLAQTLGPMRAHEDLSALEIGLLDGDLIDEKRLLMLKGSLTGRSLFDMETMRVTDALPRALVEQAGALALDMEPINGHPAVVMVDDSPKYVTTVSQAMGHPVEVFLCTRVQFSQLVKSAYVDQAELVIRPPVGSLYDVLDECIRVNASDVHLRVGVSPVMEKDSGVERMNTQRISEDWMREAVFDRLVKDRRGELEANREIDVAFKYGSVRFRVNICTQEGNWMVVARRLPDGIPTPDALDLPRAVRAFMAKPRGLFVVTGQTGSGKSTSLASLIEHEVIRKRKVHVVTLENPIEFGLSKDKVALVSQRELGLDFPSFSAGTRAVLRQAPHVILVGELRDKETIREALVAASTGHLVLGTMHSNEAIDVAHRMVGMFEPGDQAQIRQTVANSLVGVLAQELVEKAGGVGKVAVHEVLVGNSGVQNAIVSGENGGRNELKTMIAQTEGTGHRPLDMSLARLVRQGDITEKVGMQLCRDESDFKARLRNFDPSQVG